MCFCFICNTIIGFSQSYQIDTDDNYQKMDPRPSKEQIAAEQAKYQEAVKYMEEKNRLIESNDLKSMSSRSSKTNLIGNFKQNCSYTCGPASARNLIKGYVDANNYSNVPTEATLASTDYLQTTTSGTSFEDRVWQHTLYEFAPGQLYYVVWGSGSREQWKGEVKTRVNSTLDKRVYWYPASKYVDNFNVIANLYYTNGTQYPIYPYYDLTVVRHYVTVYGYNNNTEIYKIADSNNSVPMYFETDYVCLSESVKGRGIIW